MTLLRKLFIVCILSVCLTLRSLRLFGKKVITFKILKTKSLYRLNYFFIVFVLGFSLNSCGIFKPSNQGKHLFILSGQSNMVLLDINQHFIPLVEKEFGKGNVIVVKDAKGTQPISRWYKKATSNPQENKIGDLYDTLMLKVNDSIRDIKLQSVTFIWMQGERDARLANADVYEDYLLGLYDQLSNDLERKDVTFIIGRLNDFDLENKKWPHWTRIRDIQVKVAESNSNFDWVDTDEFNSGTSLKGKPFNDDIHMSDKGYEQLGQSFAEKAIQLINQKN